MPGMRDVARKMFLIARRRKTVAQTTQPAPTRTMQAHKSSVWAVAFFKDGRRVVTGSDDKTLRIWDMEKEELVGGPFEGHSDWVKSVAVSPDDRRIASGGLDHAIIIWDVESRQKVCSPLVKHTDKVWSVCFSPDGKKLASGSGDKTVIVWDAGTGAVLLTLLGHQDAVWSVAFSPDGLKLASGSCDHTIRVWRTDRTEQLLKIDDAAQQDWVQSVVWSPDGQQLVSASADTTVKFWNSLNGCQIGQPCTGHTLLISSLVISSDGCFIATASNDMTVRLWSTKSHQQIGQALKHTSWVSCLAISPNGELLVSGDRKGKVRLWSIENTLYTAFGLDSSYDFFFAHRSKGKLGRMLYVEALSAAEKVIELNPSSYLGYELQHAALHGAQRYDSAYESFKIMLNKLDNTTDAQMQKLRQKYISASKVTEATVRQAIHAHLENAPLRLINTFAGRLCDKDAQTDAFMKSTEYKKLLSSSVMHGPLQMEPIKESVAKYFSWVMLSHRWERKEPLLRNIRNKAIYELDPVGTVVKLQRFCEVARDAGYLWAWSDTCCIDQNNNAEVQRSVNSMFVWYRHSKLTIIYLSDVPPSSTSGALANSTWNTRGWTVQEFLAPSIVLFYQADWSLYLGVCSRNHKESVAIMQELEHATGIDARSLVTFHPGVTGAREKLQWASSRVTTLQEDIAYSLFGIFDIHLPVIYGETKQNALGRLLQAVVAKSGDITALDWVGQSSNFNSCLPADIFSYKASPCKPPTLSEDEMQRLATALRNTVAVESALKLYTLLENLSAPRFANSRLQLPCIAFPLTEIRRRPGEDRDKCFTYDVKADGLQDLVITTEDKRIQMSPARPTRQSFLLVRPWNRYDLELPEFTDEAQGVGYLPNGPSSLSDNSFGWSLSDHKAADSQTHMREFRMLVHLGQPFGALLLAQQRGGEYKRIASDQNIIARVRDMASVDDMMDVRTLEIL
ncbi:WD40 repeat-like protein [Suillus weaverae]|nr:WD40 repeat-like protein [Suillus weaverae]